MWFQIQSALALLALFRDDPTEARHLIARFSDNDLLTLAHTAARLSVLALHLLRQRRWPR